MREIILRHQTRKAKRREIIVTRLLSFSVNLKKVVLKLGTDENKEKTNS